MKTSIRGERKVVEQAGMSQYLFTLLFEIPQVGLNCFAKLKFEDEAFINNLYEELLNVTEKKLGESKMLYEKEGNQIAFTKYSLATLVMDLLTQSMQDLTDRGRDLLTVYIDEEKETLKKYREKTKQEVDTLKEHISNNEKNRDKFKLELEKLELEKEKMRLNAEKTAYPSSEKTSKSDGDAQVVLDTPEETKQPSGKRKVNITGAKPTDLSGILGGRRKKN